MNNNEPRAQIAVAAENSQTRARLTAILRSDPSLNLVGEADDVAGLFSLPQHPRPDILLLDSTLAHRINGVASSWSSTRIILLADTIDRQQIVQSLHLGAKGILPAGSPPKILLKSIRTVLADKYWLNADSIEVLVSVTRQLLIGPSEQFQNKKCKLTARECNVVVLIAAGSSNRQICQELSISERTVKHHLTNVFAKLGVSSRLQLANYAVTHGLIADMKCATRLHASDRQEKGADTTIDRFIARAT